MSNTMFELINIPVMCKGQEAKYDKIEFYVYWMCVVYCRCPSPDPIKISKQVY